MINTMRVKEIEVPEVRMCEFGSGKCIARAISCLNLASKAQIDGGEHSQRTLPY